MKKISSIKRLCSFFTALLFLLTPTISVADNFVLNFKTSRALVKVYLSVESDTKTVADDLTPAPGSQGDYSELPTHENTESQRSDMVGGLPVTGRIPSAQSHSSGLTSAADDTGQEQGAVGGVPTSPANGAVSLPVSVSFFDSDNRAESTTPEQPLTSQPAAMSRRSAEFLPTGSASVSAWLEREDRGAGEPFVHINENQLKTFIHVFARLVAMKADEMYSTPPFSRPHCVSDPEAIEPDHQLSCLCGNYICNSEVNPSWSYMKYAVALTFLATGAVSGVGFGIGIPELGGGCLGAGLIALGLEGLFFSHTTFPKEFQVSFTYNSSNLEIDTLQHMLPILQYSGSYELLSFSLNEQNASHTLSFRLWVTKAVNAEKLTNWLDTRNQQLANPFEIEISSIGEQADKEPVDKEPVDKEQTDGAQADDESADNKQPADQPADNKQAEDRPADNKQAENQPADNELMDKVEKETEL